MKNINWKVRLQSGSWWLGVISATVVAIFAIIRICGIEVSVSANEIINVATLILMIPSAVGITTDPTTKGLSDSAQAMSYEKPKDNESEVG